MKKYLSSVSVTPHFALLEKEPNSEEFSIFQIFNYSSGSERIGAEGDARNQLNALLLRANGKQLVVAHYENGKYKPVTTLFDGSSS
jgi:hypothetical protein